MKNGIYYSALVTLILISFSCKKDSPLSDRDQFVGTYSGKMTSMLVIEGELLEFNETTGSAIVEKGAFDNELLVKVGNQFRFDVTVDGNKFIIPEYNQDILVTVKGVTLNVPVNGQGILISPNELTISRGGYVYYENNFLKWTFVETLKKN